MNYVLFRFCFSVLFVSNVLLTNGEMVFIKPGIILCLFILIKMLSIFIFPVHSENLVSILYSIIYKSLKSNKIMKGY